MIDQNQLLTLLAGELDDAREQIEALGVALCRRADVVADHLAEIQALDHAGQRCATVGAILRSADMAAATRDAPLETITRRMQALMGEPQGQA